MAVFTFCKIKVGFDGEDIKTVYAISDIAFEPGETVVKIPSHFEDNLITHVCYFQDKRLGYPKFHDWHHPSQGYDGFVPDEYFPCKSSFLQIPTRVKKIIFPATVTNISTQIFNKFKKVEYEFDGENPNYTVVDGKIVYR